MSRKTKEGEEAAVEANLIPIMNIMFLLIPALLLAMEFASMAAINVTPPKFCNLGEPGEKPTDPQLRLKVMIREDGFLLTASETGVSLDGEKPQTIPVRAGDEFDYAALEDRARALKDAFPTTSTVTVSAEANIEMDTLVKTLDTLRGSNCSLKNVDAGEGASDCLFWQPIISAGAA